MLYTLHEATYYAASPMRAAARMTRDWWSSPLNPARNSDLGRKMSAGADLYANVTRRYGKPEWHIDEIVVNDHKVRVRPTVVWESPWCRLIQFDRDMADMRRAGKLQLDPAVLIVAPMSGHYATLLRGTVEAFAPDHAVFITDWSNARDVPMMEGRFDFDDYIDHIKSMLEALGHRAHVVAVCQPGPPVLATAALMAEENNRYRPRTMTFMGSPIDARLSPTVTNKLAEERPFTWFQSSMIYTVPAPYPGLGRRVYPGFVQLASFMSMNLERHKDAHRRYFDNLVAGDGDSADKHVAFYDEYLAVMDLTEEFYLDTIHKVFQSYDLPKGTLEHRGQLVKPAAITDIGLMTVEGELDDISGIGQTQAAHDLCPNIPEAMKLDHVQQGVGHYGVFNGRRFREEIFPKVSAFIRHCDPDF